MLKYDMIRALYASHWNCTALATTLPSRCRDSLRYIVILVGRVCRFSRVHMPCVMHDVFPSQTKKVPLVQIFKACVQLGRILWTWVRAAVGAMRVLLSAFHFRLFFTTFFRFPFFFALLIAAIVYSTNLLHGLVCTKRGLHLHQD